MASKVSTDDDEVGERAALLSSCKYVVVAVAVVAGDDDASRSMKALSGEVGRGGVNERETSFSCESINIAGWGNLCRCFSANTNY